MLIKLFLSELHYFGRYSRYVISVDLSEVPCELDVCKLVVQRLHLLPLDGSTTLAGIVLIEYILAAKL